MTHNLNVLLARVFLLGFLLAFALGLNYLHAWTAPPDAPPDGNVAAPLNTGTGVQTKSGGLQMSSLDVIGATGASVVDGQLSFWSGAIVDPAYTIDMGPLDPGANNGIRFPDGSVQTTAPPSTSVPTIDYANCVSTNNTNGRGLKSTFTDTNSYYCPLNMIMVGTDGGSVANIYCCPFI